MMKSLFKTLVKAPTLRPYTLSLSSNYWTSKFSSEQAVQPQAQGATAMEDKNDTEDYNMKKWPVPSEIPFQPKVANWVNFIGTIRMPVQFVTLANGTSWAGTVLSQDCKSELRLLWVPIIFEGDLAHTAAMHLKQMDIVHIAGQLSSDPVPINLTNDRVNVQVAHQTIDRLACQLWSNWSACLGLNRVEDIAKVVLPHWSNWLMERIVLKQKSSDRRATH